MTPIGYLVATTTQFFSDYSLVITGFIVAVMIAVFGLRLVKRGFAWVLGKVLGLFGRGGRRRR